MAGGFRLYMVRDITSLQEQSGTLSGPFEVGTPGDSHSDVDLLTNTFSSLMYSKRNLKLLLRGSGSLDGWAFLEAHGSLVLELPLLWQSVLVHPQKTCRQCQAKLGLWLELFPFYTNLFFCCRCAWSSTARKNFLAAPLELIPDLIIHNWLLGNANVWRRNQSWKVNTTHPMALLLKSSWPISSVKVSIILLRIISTTWTTLFQSSRKWSAVFNLDLLGIRFRCFLS